MAVEAMMPLDPEHGPSWKRFGVCTGTRSFVYRLFDSGGDLLYVGFTWNPYERWTSHRRTKPWWPEVAFVSLSMHEGDLPTRAAETRAIHEERPRYNIHQVRRTSGTHQNDQASVLPLV